MSHASLWVLFDPPPRPPLAEAPGPRGPEPDPRLVRRLAPFDENRRVRSYERRCWCVGKIALRRAEEAADAVGLSRERIRAAFHSDPATAELRRIVDDFRSAEELGVAESVKRAAHREVDRLWAEATRPRQERVLAELRKARDRNHPDPACTDCRGTGRERTTCNPRAKWDWWSVGGRWSGAITGVPRDHDGFGERGSLEHNARLVREIPPAVLDPLDGELPFALLGPDGVWHERGRMGWFGAHSESCGHADCEADPEMMRECLRKRPAWEERCLAVLRAHPRALAVAVDYHI